MVFLSRGTSEGHRLDRQVRNTEIMTGDPPGSPSTDSGLRGKGPRHKRTTDFVMLTLPEYFSVMNVFAVTHLSNEIPGPRGLIQLGIKS